MKNKMLLLGGTGGLGQELTKLFQEDYEVTSVGSKDLDITDFRKLELYFHVNVYDVIINLSGYNHDSFLHKYDEDLIHEAKRQLDVNTLGSVNLLAACLPKMREKGYGRIILASSVLSSRPVIGTSVYSASKSFIDSLVKTCALENCSKGITCNAVQMGYFDAGMAHRLSEDFQSIIKRKIPMNRFGSIQELYDTIVYLISTEYVTGTSLKINGGLEF